MIHVYIALFGALCLIASFLFWILKLDVLHLFSCVFGLVFVIVFGVNSTTLFYRQHDYTEKFEARREWALANSDMPGVSEKVFEWNGELYEVQLERLEGTLSNFYPESVLSIEPIILEDS